MLCRTPGGAELLLDLNDMVHGEQEIANIIIKVSTLKFLKESATACTNILSNGLFWLSVACKIEGGQQILKRTENNCPRVDNVS